MSALPHSADSSPIPWDVRKVPIGDLALMIEKRKRPPTEAAYRRDHHDMTIPIRMMASAISIQF
jgi:hypothetical protein